MLYRILFVSVVVSEIMLCLTEDCMTRCMPLKNDSRTFCYTNWEKWKYCDESEVKFEVTFYTAMLFGSKPVCNGLCGVYNYTGSWCYTGNNETGISWDLCSSSSGMSSTINHRCVSPCVKDKSFRCMAVNGTNKSCIIDFCSPTPIDVRFLLSMAEKVSKLEGRCYIAESCNRLSTNISERLEGVEDLARQYEELFVAERKKWDIKLSPVTSVVSLKVPLEKTGEVALPLVVRATLTPDHIICAKENCNNQSTYHNIIDRMRNMDSLPADVFTNLLPTSLGGPNEELFIVPRPSFVPKFRNGYTFWSIINMEIKSFLQRYRNSRVEWIMVIAYGDFRESKRPTGFALTYRQYDNSGRLVLDSGDCFFSNSPNSSLPVACLLINT